MMPTGAAAGDANFLKKLGSRKLEVLPVGASGEFEGYQPDLQYLQQPRQLDADDDSVATGSGSPRSILSSRSMLAPGLPAVPAEDRLTGLERSVSALQYSVAKPMLSMFVGLICSRQMGEAGQRSEVKPSCGMQDAVNNGGPAARAVQNFISRADPTLLLTPTSVTMAMDSNYDNYDNRNDLQHVNNDERLASMAAELHAMQAVDILRSSMPVECEILIHYKTLM